VEELGGPSLPGIGFAMGVERLVLLLQDKKIETPPPALFLATLGKDAEEFAFKVLHQLQREGIYAEMDFTGRSLKAQLRRADKLNCRYTIMIGDNELSEGSAQLKRMADGDQQAVQLSQLLEQLRPLLDDASTTSL